ncbi:uncharacterized protein [Diabrotica undecimpunctata]|uniref:uncharacterized protein n=1 Tax=Diabrotica undecimpunctata TaxID=50387 RepID=UPI003B635196
MYRQILIHDAHKPLQQILWRDNPADEFSIYQLNTVTYGCTSSPYLAIKCINQLAIDNCNTLPTASQTILNDFYVDDLVTGSNDLSELQTRCKDISDILKSAQFILRKWVTNNPSVLLNIPCCDIPNEILNFGEHESCKTLGVQFNSNKDILNFKISSIPHDNSITKRKILSIISQIWDPLGLLSPVIVLSKLIIQKLWTFKLNWDEKVPHDIYIKWTQFYNQLSQLNQLEIPRHVLGSNHSILDIHCFCDASQDAYASCIYFRSIDASGNYQSHLICSKSKVAPLKRLTIPRLELCAALLGAQLTAQVVNASSPSVPIQYYWSDSQIVVCWIKKDANQLQQFVGNRVAKIQQLTNKDDWYYVNTKENPSDLASRGVLPEDLANRELWWKGPIFLRGPIDKPAPPAMSEIELPEQKVKSSMLLATHSVPLFLFSRFSNISTLKHVVIYCFRFRNNACKKRSERTIGLLTLSEVEEASLRLIKLVQLDSFAEEISILNSNKPLPMKHKLSNLTPFLDENHVLRVGGRLRLSGLDFNSKHPILISSNHPFNKLLFEHKHKVLLHAGPQLLLSSIRQYYWPIRGRDLARKTVRNCLTCFKFKPTFASCPMASLPEARTTPSLPFQHCGIDFAGPFLLNNKSGRGAKEIKGYVCVFVCFCTKAIHLELITNLTTDCFLFCLKRFIARRGIPNDIYSDNGSTFVGARNELKQFGQFLLKNNTYIHNYAIDHNINWHFIPPYAPNFGGLWEAAVKSMKHHLKRVLLDKKLIYEDFNSLLIQIEGVLNSRPMFALSNDPTDLTPLTPSHFLIGRPITTIPDTDLSTLPIGRLSNYKTIRHIYQQFWNRYVKEYVSQLQQQYKWKESSSHLKIGTLVLIRSYQQPPCRWPLGRIINLHSGKDKLSRVAEVKTNNKTVIRSVRHLCPFPMQQESVSENINI